MGELKLPRTTGFCRLEESGHRRRTGTEHSIDLRHVRSVEQVETFRDQVQSSNPPNGKYFTTRRSMVTIPGSLIEFLPNSSGLADSGKAPLRFESSPVIGFTG